MTVREFQLMLDRSGKLGPGWFIGRFLEWLFTFEWVRVKTGQLTKEATDDGVELGLDPQAVADALRDVDLNGDHKVLADSADPSAGYLDAKVQRSVTVDATAHKLQLTNDEDTPNPVVAKYYGFDEAGARGFHEFPAAGPDEKVKLEAGDPTAGYLGEKAQHSLVADTDTPRSYKLQLDGDAAAPGNSKLYGTNGAGAKGWYDQPVDNKMVLADSDDVSPEYLDEKSRWSLVVDLTAHQLQLLGDADPAGAGGNPWLYYGNDSLGNRGFHQLGPVRADSDDPTPDFLAGKVQNSITVAAADKLELLGDAAHPVGAWKYYGEDGAGNRGFHQLGPVRADAADTSPGFLEAKCENSIEVNQTTDKLHLVGDDGAVPAWSLYGADGTGGNDHKGWQSTTQITVITAVRLNGGALEYKSRTLQALNPGTESDWTPT